MALSDLNLGLIIAAGILVILVMSIALDSEPEVIQNQGVVEENNEEVQNEEVSNYEPVDIGDKLDAYDGGSNFTEYNGTHNQRMNGYIAENNKNMTQKLNSSDLLPHEQDNDWFQTDVSVSKNELGQLIPMLSTSNRNANQQIRDEIPNPQTVVSPFLQTTIVAQNNEYDKKFA